VTRQRHGKLDVLVNNAAITYDTRQRAVTADLDVVREAAETNLYGPWLLGISIVTSTSAVSLHPGPGD
jgi:NAD(P)-dependent dehydrogenase (short-subunit alcohol dehydrogenase family)